MKRAFIVLAVFALVAFAGDVVSGCSDMIKFTGYGTFRWDVFGQEDNNPGSSMSTYSYIAWCPKLNEYVDGTVSATVTTPGDEDIKVDCAFLNLHFAENFTLTGGQFKVPFGYAYTRPGGSMYFADRSSILAGWGQFGYFGGHDINTMLTAEFAPVTIDLALSNGNGMNAPSNDLAMKKQFTARVVAEPTEWLELGGSYAMISSDPDTIPDVDESWGATGMDFYAVVNYPVSPTGELVFVGEYQMWNAPDNLDDADAGNGMSVMAGYDMDLEGDVLMGIMPAVRYDMVTPWDPTGEAEDTGRSWIDACVNLQLFSEKNTLQLGMRNYAREQEDWDGYTNMYAKWRMNF